MTADLLMAEVLISASAAECQSLVLDNDDDEEGALTSLCFKFCISERSRRVFMKKTIKISDTKNEYIVLLLKVLLISIWLRVLNV